MEIKNPIGTFADEILPLLFSYTDRHQNVVDAVVGLFKFCLQYLVLNHRRVAPEIRTVVEAVFIGEDDGPIIPLRPRIFHPGEGEEEAVAARIVIEFFVEAKGFLMQKSISSSRCFRPLSCT
ncbi:hypothetical protein PEPNEM18_01145 [Aedoeadaptatus nemausensis]|uniref:Uncharacterized protein n=1 Tax=Aedoeadaptatus nemausensis TaxID=2582829 RepID=A0A6V6Y5Y9_9FIRM|nr:hypothetical protein [Peptoniphilus nemausensis]CAC9931978.1 hypothetical protein PEPNEM18_01145 [Peptoniphilus nemausensis]